MAKSHHYVNSNGEQIDLTVYVTTRPNLRDGVDYMLHSRGKNILSIMFDECRVDETVEEFDMMYPERWANLLELRAITSRMVVCFPNLKQAEIKTHSVYVVQTVHHEHIGIYPQSVLTDENGEPLQYDEGDPKDLSRRYCDPPREFTGLWSTGSGGFSRIHPPIDS